VTVLFQKYRQYKVENGLENSLFCLDDIVYEIRLLFENIFYSITLKAKIGDSNINLSLVFLSMRHMTQGCHGGVFILRLAR
jgi:hypothetical protein